MENEVRCGACEKGGPGADLLERDDEGREIGEHPYKVLCRTCLKGLRKSGFLGRSHKYVGVKIPVRREAFLIERAKVHPDTIRVRRV